jgi:hypothetical protein
VSPELPPYRRGEGFGSLGVRFREVLEPAPAELWPETPGAWITIAVLMLGAIFGIGWLWLRHSRRRHRRLAANELVALRRAWDADQKRLDVLEGLPAVLKRCALGSFERARVAPLSGERWVEFLSTTGPEPFGDDQSRRALVTIATRGAKAVAEADAVKLFAAADTWIRRHRAEL